jgi:hypothetical protein
MIGGLRSLHELELASGARMVVVVDFDIRSASRGPSTGTDASTGGVAELGGAAEPNSDALDRAVRPDPLADASAIDRSAPRPSRDLHAVVPTNTATST